LESKFVQIKILKSKSITIIYVDENITNKIQHN